MTTLHLNTISFHGARLQAHSLAARIGLLVVGLFLLTISAKIQVPAWPVPTTLQALVVLLIGAIYGPRLAMATVGSYLLVGLAGAPVFAKGGGLHYVWSPTFGYLVGYVLAAGLVAVLLQRWPQTTKRRVPLFGVMMLGAMTILLSGGVWLAMLTQSTLAMQGGIMPFLVVDTVKAALATTMIYAWATRQR